MKLVKLHREKKKKENRDSLKRENFKGHFLKQLSIMPTLQLSDFIFFSHNDASEFNINRQ